MDDGGASMPPSIPEQASVRLHSEPNIWLASVRADGRPHLVPIWFVLHDARLYLCTTPHSVKTRNIAAHPQVALALEGGSSPVICEGRAQIVPPPWPADVIDAFQSKYDWRLATDAAYSTLIEVTPHKWLTW